MIWVVSRCVPGCAGEARRHGRPCSNRAHCIRDVGRSPPSPPRSATSERGRTPAGTVTNVGFASCFR
eukprot:4194943-Alexandrium_andersonii.AAC.1